MKMRDLLHEGRRIQEKFKKNNKNTYLNEAGVIDMLGSVIKKAMIMKPQELLDIMGEKLELAHNKLKSEMYPRLSPEQIDKMEKIKDEVRKELESEIRSGMIKTTQAMAERYVNLTAEKVQKSFLE